MGNGGYLSAIRYHANGRFELCGHRLTGRLSCSVNSQSYTRRGWGYSGDSEETRWTTSGGGVIESVDGITKFCYMSQSNTSMDRHAFIKEQIMTASWDRVVDPQSYVDFILDLIKRKVASLKLKENEWCYNTPLIHGPIHLPDKVLIESGMIADPDGQVGMQLSTPPMVDDWSIYRSHARSV